MSTRLSTRAALPGALAFTLVMFGPLPGAARGEFIAFEATGTVTSAQGALATGSVALGMPFRATLWFDSGAGYPVGLFNEWPVWGGMTVRVDEKLSFASSSHWGGLPTMFARVGLEPGSFPDPGGSAGTAPIVGPHLRVESYFSQLWNRAGLQPGGYSTSLTFAFPLDGLGTPFDRWLTDLDLATPINGRVGVSEAWWSGPADQRFRFEGTIAEVRALGPWQETPEPGALALAGVGAGVACLARWARRRRQPEQGP